MKVDKLKRIIPENKEEWRAINEMKKRIRDENLIKYNLNTKRTVSVDYNWLDYVYDEIYNNKYSILEWWTVLESMLWSEVTIPGFSEPKVLTVKYLCYDNDSKYILYNTEKLIR